MSPALGSNAVAVNRYAKNTMTKPERSDKTDKTDKTVGSMRVQRGLAES